MTDRINAARDALRAIANVIDLTKHQDVRAAALEAQQKIVTLQQANLDLQEQKIEAQKALMQTEADLQRLKSHLETKDEFDLVETHPGSLVVYRRRQEGDNGPAVPFCHPCFERGERSALSFDQGGDITYKRRCQTCGAIAVFKGPAYENRARPGDEQADWDPFSL